MSIVGTFACTCLWMPRGRNRAPTAQHCPIQWHQHAGSVCLCLFHERAVCDLFSVVSFAMLLSNYGNCVVVLNLVSSQVGTIFALVKCSALELINLTMNEAIDEANLLISRNESSGEKNIIGNSSFDGTVAFITIKTLQRNVKLIA